ncbi:MAG: hypothetical protein JW940_12655 [Polyangiaceae bacterium]|nr:hypothetical protein [Polyangiaceae bacterium]
MTASLIPQDLALDAVNLVARDFERLAPAKLRHRSGDCFVVIDVFEGRVDLAFLDADELDTVIATATGWSRDGEMELRAMPRQSNALRLLVIDTEGWRTTYLVRPTTAVNAKGGEV